MRLESSWLLSVVLKHTQSSRDGGWRRSSPPPRTFSLLWRNRKLSHDKEVAAFSHVGGEVHHTQQWARVYCCVFPTASLTWGCESCFIPKIKNKAALTKVKMHFGLYWTAAEERTPNAKSSERDYSEPSSVFNVSCVPMSFWNDFLQNKEDILHRGVCSWMLWGYADFYLFPLCILCIWTSMYFCVF